MGFYVHLHVCFACNDNGDVAALALQHLPEVDKSECLEAAWFLRDLSERTGRNKGSKGGLSLWGAIGNYTNGDMFCETLMPFWRDLLSGKCNGGPCAHENVVVFSEVEQSESATAYQIGWDDAYSDNRLMVVCRHDRLPFSWRQM